MPPADERLIAWLVALDVSYETEHELLKLLDRAECDRAAAFAFATHRRRFIARRAARRVVLSDLLGIPPEAVPFTEDVRGKPSVPLPVSFSASHSGELAAIAVLSQSPLGIDVEWPNRSHADHAALAPFVEAATLDRLSSLSGEQRTAAFFRCWTRVEALSKATGTGITHWPDCKFPESAESDGFVVWPNTGGELSRWNLRTWTTNQGYIVSVATGGGRSLGARDLEIREVTLSLGPTRNPFLAPAKPRRTSEPAYGAALS